MRGGGLLHWLNNQNRLTNATKNDDTTSYVSVGEIWNAENGTFNANTLNTLLQYITNDADVTASAVTALGSINMTKTSADIRTSTVNGKTTSQDVQVTFGGLTWQVVHLTQDRDGNDIVTLWLSSNVQDEFVGASSGAHHSISSSGALTSRWSGGSSLYNNYFTVKDTNGNITPTNMYSTSYIRVVTLNNGGDYISSQSGSSSSSSSVMTLTTDVPQDKNNVFAMFTMNGVAGSVTEYLVKPREVKYQETEAAANSNVNSRAIYPNEAYGTPSGGSWYTHSTYGSGQSMTNNTYYDAWADDTIWLPSLSETGYTDDYNGLWETSTPQRQNTSTYPWLRSGGDNYAYLAYNLTASGSGKFDYNVSDSYAVRPALHLNLNSVAQSAVDAAKTWDGISTEAPTLQNSSASNSETNPYIIDTAAKLAWISANYNNSNCYGKYYLQTENLDLAGHPWTPINNSNTIRAYYYDGGGHTVSNLYINTAEQTLNSNNRIGLFGYVYGSSSKHAYIKNLGIVNGSITGEDSDNVGAVVGDAGYTDITSCYNEGVSVTGSERVGGVVGYNNNIGIISNSYNTGDVTGESQVGGVGGYNWGGLISNSYNTGTVTGSSNYVGGVIGYNNIGIISNSYNIGDVTGIDSVGGVVGRNYGTISNSYNTGDVTGSSSVGGVAGRVVSSSGLCSVISGCYSTGAIIRSSGSETSFGGVVGYIYNDPYNNPSQYVSISWCYYNKETSGSVVTKAIGEGTGYQCYGLTTTEMQGAQNENWMYLSSTYWNFASGQYPTLKYVVKE